MNANARKGIEQSSRAIYLAHKPNGGLGGSDPETVKQQIRDAMDAIRDAQMALLATTGNGRDYSPETLEIVQLADASRMARLSSVIEELHDMHDAWDF